MRDIREKLRNSMLAGENWVILGGKREGISINEKQFLQANDAKTEKVHLFFI